MLRMWRIWRMFCKLFFLKIFFFCVPFCLPIVVCVRKKVQYMRKHVLKFSRRVKNKIYRKFVRIVCIQCCIFFWSSSLVFLFYFFFSFLSKTTFKLFLLFRCVKEIFFVRCTLFFHRTNAFSFIFVSLFFLELFSFIATIGTHHRQFYFKCTTWYYTVILYRTTVLLLYPTLYTSDPRCIVCAPVRVCGCNNFQRVIRCDTMPKWTETTICVFVCIFVF